MQSPTACLIIIGNEILSGRTQDKNLSTVAVALNDCGIRLREVRVIPDVMETIIDTVNYCRKAYSYVFTTGGIGPTHDDITSEAIARAFNLAYTRHKGAEAILKGFYKPEQLNPARLKMADMPKDASLIENPVSTAPGFYVENVFVMAGVPSICKAMMDAVKPLLKGGEKWQSRIVSAYVTEGNIAASLTALQAQYSALEIGSYPFMRDGKFGTSLVVRGIDTASLNACAEEMEKLCRLHTEQVFREDLSDV